MKKLLLVTALLITTYASSWELIDGNSQEYIMTMEDLIRAEQLLSRSIDLMQKAHLEGYSLPNSTLPKILEDSSVLQEGLILLIRPERLRSNASTLVPSGGFITKNAENITQQNLEVRK